MNIWIVDAGGERASARKRQRRQAEVNIQMITNGNVEKLTWPKSSLALILIPFSPN